MKIEWEDVSTLYNETRMLTRKNIFNCGFPVACVSGFLFKGRNSLLRFTNTSPGRFVISPFPHRLYKPVIWSHSQQLSECRNESYSYIDNIK